MIVKIKNLVEELEDKFKEIFKKIEWNNKEIEYMREKRE